MRDVLPGTTPPRPRPVRAGRGLATPWMGVLILLLACLGLAVAQEDAGSTPPSDPGRVLDALEQALDQVPLVDRLGRDIAELRTMDVYDRASPAVVNITTRVLRLEGFFGVVPEEGAGSGFLIDEEGHVLTNFHVVEDAERIEVAFDDETVLPARFVGADPQNDLAVLRVDPDAELPAPLELGSSRDLRVGQRAIAIGNPFGRFGKTLTTGVVSALERTLTGPEGVEIPGVIQTDAAINRGNSGGPLLDSAGRVIGIATAIFSPTGTSSGVGFAIPIDTVKRVLPELLAFGRVRRPWLGIRAAHAVTPRLARALELPADHGLLLVELAPDGPLARAGARGATRQAVLGNRRLYLGGDLLVELDGRPIHGYEALRRELDRERAINEHVPVTLYRDGQRREVEVVLRERP